MTEMGKKLYVKMRMTARYYTPDQKIDVYPLFAFDREETQALSETSIFLTNFSLFRTPWTRSTDLPYMLRGQYEISNARERCIHTEHNDNPRAVLGPKLHHSAFLCHLAIACLRASSPMDFAIR